MRRNTIHQLLALVGAIIIAAVVWISVKDGRGFGAIETRREAPPTRASATVYAESHTVKARGAALRIIWPLPAEDSPLASNYETLKAHADAGDVSASCRLAFELNRCVQLPELRELSEHYIAQSAASKQGTPEDQADTEVAVRLENSLRSAESVCEGFHPDPGVKAWKYLLRAAKAGHVPSMVRYAVQPPLSEQRFADEAEGWAEYRKEAGPLLLRAAQNGNSAAAYYLFMAYYGVPMPGGAEIVKPSKVNALTYAIVVQGLADGPSTRSIERAIGKLETTLSLDMQREAEVKARKLLNTSYAGALGGQDFISNPVPADPRECDSF